MDSTPQRKKTTVKYFESKAHGLRDHSESPCLFELIETVSECVCDHLILSHPIFDYIETTAQRPEISAFVHAEISREYLLLGLDAPRVPTSAQPMPPLLGTQGYCPFARMDGTASSHSSGNRYLVLLQYLMSKLSRDDTVLEQQDRLHINVPHHGLPSDWGNLLNRSRMGSVILLIQSNIYQRVRVGCLRLGIIPQNCDNIVSSDSADHSIKAALHAALREQPFDTLGQAEAISGFLDWKVAYYDQLFHTILRSS
ncbi:hypothetical protein [Trinickia diaoshuihuensis]|uniref:hypothetical protein n=1 Tax=Trinickia diaoshuihuensis TaxID=2292265 RepID=UPI0013C2C351|nr:hypothetical protein [Trinickia diaoshuihuensis]